MAGVEVTSKINGNTLFFPAGGYRFNNSTFWGRMCEEGQKACYGASEVEIGDPTVATSASFDIDGTVSRNSWPKPYRYEGFNVRAVTE